MADNEKGEWKELTEDQLCEMMNSVIDFCNTECNINWDQFNYQIYGPDWYRDKFGEGFPDDWYELMAKASEDNFVDYREHNLKIEKKDVTINFE